MIGYYTDSRASFRETCSHEDQHRPHAVALLALIQYDMQSFTPSACDKAMTDAQATISTAVKYRAALRQLRVIYNAGHGVLSLYDRPCTAAADAIKTRVDSYNWIAAIHLGQAKLYLGQLMELRDIDNTIERVEIWTWMRFFRLTTAASARLADWFGGRLAHDMETVLEICSRRL